jgi:hypothetical protein
LPSSAVFSCKAHALLVLVEYALKASSPPLFSDSTSEGGYISDLVGLLIDITTMHGSLDLDKSANAIHQAARSCLSQTVGVMPALDFMASLLKMLESGENRVGDNLSRDIQHRCRLKLLPLTSSQIACRTFQTVFMARSLRLLRRFFPPFGELCLCTTGRI